MNKILKVGAITLMSGIIVFSSGCSCNASKKKTEENTKLVAETDVFGIENDIGDYVIKYEGSTVSEDSNDNVTYVIRRDSDNNKFELEFSSEDLYYKTQIYKEGNKIYSVYIDKDGNKDTPVESEYTSVYAEAEENTLYALVKTIYDEYKKAPYYAFSEDKEDDAMIPNILANRPELESKAKKKLFKDEYTSHLVYRVSRAEFNTVDITVKNGKMTSLVVDSDKNTSESGHIDSNFSLTLEYTDIEL